MSENKQLWACNGEQHWICECLDKRLAVLQAENAELRTQLAEARAGQAAQYRAAHEAERQLAEARAALNSAIVQIESQIVRSEERSEDAELLDWWENHLSYEHGEDPESDDVVIYCVTGHINDREWHEVSRGATLRVALRAAADAAKEPR